MATKSPSSKTLLLCIATLLTEIRSIVFIHGLQRHSRGTWETAVSTSGSSSKDITKASRRNVKSLFKRRTIDSGATETAETQAASSAPASSSSPKVFWLEDYLALDLPQAQLWTYGYDADVIGGLFQANNRISIPQHRRGLSVLAERSIDNKVGRC